MTSKEICLKDNKTHNSTNRYNGCMRETESICGQRKCCEREREDFVGLFFIIQTGNYFLGQARLIPITTNLFPIIISRKTCKLSLSLNSIYGRRNHLSFKNSSHVHIKSVCVSNHKSISSHNFIYFVNIFIILIFLLISIMSESEHLDVVVSLFFNITNVFLDGS